MGLNQPIEVVTAHAEGEIGNVIVGGVEPPSGDTLWAMRDWLHQDGQLRDLMLNEPRGGVFTHANLIVPAFDPRAALGFLIMEPMHSPPMSGSNAMCVAKVALAEGLVRIKEPITEFTLEAPAGLVPVRAYCEEGRVKAIELTNVPAFADQLDATVEVAGLGTLGVDVAWGGDSFVIVNASDLGLSLVPGEGRDIAAMGAQIIKAANAQLKFRHPENSWTGISFCQFAGPLTQESGVKTAASAVVIEPGKIDRSPCGTGCSARMAVLAARGHLREGDTFVGRSIIGGRFDCQIEAEATVGERPAIVPRIRGRVWITGRQSLEVDPTDPWPRGYRVSDTWPGA